MHLDIAGGAALDRRVERYGLAPITQRPTEVESLVKQTPSEARSSM
ncbi:MAG: hypothetical protein ACK42I_05590 [Thermomicrobium sp.]